MCHIKAPVPDLNRVQKVDAGPPYYALQILWNVCKDGMCIEMQRQLTVNKDLSDWHRAVAEEREFILSLHYGFQEVSFIKTIEK